MERLTAYDADDYAYVKGGKVINKKVAEAILRLAAYEDTGLEPDEIPHWIPVSERLPEADTPVICYCNNGHLQHLYQRVGYWSVDRSWHDSWDGREIPVTHWMPLPQPPKEEK